MPIYEYTCSQCGGVIEALRKMAEADEPIACDRCGSGNTHRKHSAFFADDGGSRKELSLPSGGGCGCGDPTGPCNL